jgi:3-hydroxy acid dehydrogenase/malonic semialdehyde reductase
MRKTILITGATSGIGKAAALRFAAENWNVILVGRRKERLHDLSEQISKEFKVDVLPVCVDVSQRYAVENAIAGLPGGFQKIDVLLNNAGGAKGLSTFMDGNPDDWEWMVDVNLKGLMYMTHAVLPLMKKEGRGHIINIGSIAGREIYPNGNVYCAVKAAVDMLSKGLRIELLKEGIKVTHVAPGAANTEFSLVRFEGDQQKADSVYNGYQPMTGEDVADAIFYAANMPYEVNISDIEVLPRAQGGTNFVHRS